MKFVRSALFVCLAGGVVALAWALRAESASSRQHEGQLNERLAELEKGLASAQRLARRSSLPRVVQAPAQPAPSATSAAQVEQVNLEVPTGPALTTDELRTEYANAFESESVDTGWAHTTHASQLPHIQRLLPATSRIESFECRSRFCRLRVVHDSVDTSNGFLMSLFSAERGGPLASTTAGFRAASPTPTPDGKHSYDIYIAALGVGLALGQEDDPHGPEISP